MKKQRVFLYLTGGLGNQLFQLAAALAETNHCIFVESESGKPRSTLGTPDILDLDLSQITPKILPLRLNLKSRHIPRVFGLLIRSHLSYKKNFMYKSFVDSIRVIANIVLMVSYRKVFSLVVPRNVGYEGQKKTFVKDKFLVGYFQSYRYVDNNGVKEQLMKIRPLTVSSKLENLIDLALQEKPTFVHLRLKDYINHQHFGIPNLDYYREAISSLQKSGSDKIWIFSDDSKSAHNFARNFENASVVDDADLTPAQVLELFRYGDNYVIANSTFSWWGAYLRRNESAKVIAPTPWFKLSPEPYEIVPPNWERLRAF
jgi:hypothetical protein